MKNLTLTQTNKDGIAVICPNGMVKFYNMDGSRNENCPSGFYNSKDLEFYKENYIVRFSN